MIWLGIIIGWLLYSFMITLGYVIERSEYSPIFLFLNGLFFPFVPIFNKIRDYIKRTAHKEWWD